MDTNYFHARDELGNTVAFVFGQDGSVYVQVQGEGDHPLTRRARANAALKSAGLDIRAGEYLGCQVMTHRNSNGDSYGSLHLYDTK